MMTNEEILREAKASFKLEGMEITKEDEKRAMSCLLGLTTFEDAKNEIKTKYIK